MMANFHNCPFMRSGASRGLTVRVLVLYSPSAIQPCPTRRYLKAKMGRVWVEIMEHWEKEEVVIIFQNWIKITRVWRLELKLQVKINGQPAPKEKEKNRMLKSHCFCPSCPVMWEFNALNSKMPRQLPPVLRPLSAKQVLHQRKSNKVCQVLNLWILPIKQSRMEQIIVTLIRHPTIKLLQWIATLEFLRGLLTRTSLCNALVEQ